MLLIILYFIFYIIYKMSYTGRLYNEYITANAMTEESKRFLNYTYYRYFLWIMFLIVMFGVFIKYSNNVN
jgi:hypothetical protein